MSESYLEFCKKIAGQAGAILRDNWEGQFSIQKKGEIDLVTEIDLKVESMVIGEIQKNYPDHGILAEESGLSEPQKSHLWIIDPLDGTTNFAHGYPSFCVSIALEIDGVLEVGCVVQPLLQECFYAQRGKGAFCNDRRIHVSEVQSISDSLLCTGFAYDVRENKKNNLAQFEQFILQAQGVRRDGAAAIDLCYLACGRFDGFWEFNLKPWDLAAGVLIIQEAGGVCQMMDGGDFVLRGTEVCASNGLIQSSMIEVLRGVGR